MKTLRVQAALVSALGGLIGFGLLGCKTGSGAAKDESISAGDLKRHIKVLASDKFEGRAPATRGEELTVAYLTNEFCRLGLAPGVNGSFVQAVPLVGSIASNVSGMFAAGQRRIALDFPRNAVVWTKRLAPNISLQNSEVVFVGYGVVAPEYGWDDFKDVDVRGKTVLMLVNDPAIPDPRAPGKLDPSMFQGRAMTYYGRWTYKFEIAAEKGAAAAIIIHETGPAGYPWAVVAGSNSRENFDLQSTNQNAHRVQVEGWITTEAAQQLLAGTGHDLARLKAAAIKRDFRPVTLGSRASFSFSNHIRKVESQNVIAQVVGSDPELKDEAVVFTAHWDHLGRDESLAGDQIFNGARDNASGIAALLEIGRAFAALKTPAKRTVVFAAVTAEEKGLLGAKHYVHHPVYPIAKTVANINMDSMNPWGPTKDVTVVGYGQTTIEDVVREVAGRQGRTIIPDAEPEKGRYYRSDHFEFAKVGVPGLYLHAGTNYIGKPDGFGARKIAEYVAQDYHKVSDELKKDWDLTGAAEDAQLLFGVARTIADERRWPEWKEGSEFRKLRSGQR